MHLFNALVKCICLVCLPDAFTQYFYGHFEKLPFQLLRVRVKPVVATLLRYEIGEIWYFLRCP
jgi:hypothetical protein